MVHFVGAGPGAPDLITLRGQALLKEADCVIYAGSLVNPELLRVTKEGCRICNSAYMTLDEVIGVMKETESAGLMTVRLHTGDPSLFGAVREQMDRLDSLGISWDVTPGVSSFCAAAASLGMEYTLPGISQSVIITRMEGRTAVPERESVRELASHGVTMVFFLSAGMIPELCQALKSGGYAADTPAAVVCRASWPDELTAVTDLAHLPEEAERLEIRKTALIIVGRAAAQTGYSLSKLYDPSFSTEYRTAGKSPRTLSDFT